MFLIEGNRLLLARRIWIWESEDQRPSRVMLNVTFGVLVVTMNVSVQNGYVFIRRKQVHRFVAVACEPFPIRTQIEQRPMCENNDRRSLRESRQVVFQPRKLICAQFRLRPGNVVESDEMHAFVVERIVRFAEVFTEEHALVETSIVLSRHVEHLWRLDSRRNFLE